LKNEAETRKELIDNRLADAGWDINDLTRVVTEFNIRIKDGEVEDKQGVYTSKQYSDYVLLGKDGNPLAVVEAKSSSKDAEIGREQAKQYCYNIQKQNNGELPFCFYTNGYDIFFWDLENYPPRKVHGFPSLDDLERYGHIRRGRKSLSEELINTEIAGRDYQINAIRNVMEAIERKKRQFLLVMATGTGKTRTSIALVEALMRGGWVERVLFLVDRVALKDQALDAFKEYLPNEPRWPKKEEKTIANDRRIYVSTYPSMLNVVRDEETQLSPHFFDLVLIDESHRSIYNTYKEVLDYFDTITLGLTATPTNVIDHNTFKLFECDDGLPTFAYSYEEAVNNIPPYLSNFQVMKISTHFQEDGISKRTISLQDQKRLILEGKEIEEINFEGSELERNVVNKGTNALIIKEFMEESIKDSNGVLPGKTIFFCMTKAHARRMEKLIDAMYPEYNGELAKVLVSEDNKVHGKGGLLDQFKNRDMPRIALSVDMLDTGVDIREITNLVFAKPVYSYTKFWQMIGRGTRLLEPSKLNPWCMEKDTFLILDCWDNFEYFKLNPKGKELKPQIPLPVRVFGLRLEKLGLALELDHLEIAIKEAIHLQDFVALLPTNSVTILDAQSELSRLNNPDFWNSIDESKLSFLKHTIQPLMRTISDVDFKAMRFERDVIEISIAHLADDKNKYQALSESIIEKIQELPMSVNIVNKEDSFIQKTRTAHFWSTANDDSFNELIHKISPLMKYVDSFVKPLGVAKFDFMDTLSKKEMVEFGPQHESVSISKYKEMVELRINELTASNLILQKLQKGSVLTEEEIGKLSEQLHDEHPHITLETLRKIYDHRKAKFISFIKHILGVEVLLSYSDTVGELFEKFIAEHNYLGSRQIDFLNILKAYIIERGEVSKKNLIEAPFTRIHPEGILGLFPESEIEEILILINKAA
jgi:type I restriction enzyme R subunit